MSRVKIGTRLLSTCACFLLTVSQVSGQSLTSGDIAGTVRDPSGAVIPQAEVKLTNNGTGATRSTTTNGQGYYRFPFLPPGPYTVEATATDFEAARKAIHAQVGKINTADFDLALAPTATSVVVHGGPPPPPPAPPAPPPPAPAAPPTPAPTPAVKPPVAQLDTENGDIAVPVTPLQLAWLPNPGNDLTYYPLLTPGTVLSTNGGEGNFSAFGLPALSNVFTINGGIDNDSYFNVSNAGATNMLLGWNDIGEATVVNNAYSGQYGGLAGSQVNYVSKSGTNLYHGNAVYFWNGRALNANNFFNNSFSEPRPFSNVNMWATSFGGPIPKQKDKTFFFFDYEATRIVLPTNNIARIPSPQFASATLANLQATGQTQAVPFYQNIFNLYAGAADASSAVPVPGGGCGTFTLLGPGVPCALQFRANAGNFTSEYIWTLRGDHIFSDKDRAFVQVQRDNGTQPTYTDPIAPIFDIFSQQPEMNGQFSETHIFNPNLVNQFILTGQFYSSRFGPPDENAVLAVFPTVIAFFPALFSNMGGQGFAFPQGRRATQYQVINDLTKSISVHTFKAGINFRRVDLTDLSFQSFEHGAIVEESLGDFFNGGGPNNFLQQQFPSITEAPYAYYSLGFYAQDQWRITPTFNITAALRGDHNSNPVCQVNCFANLAAPFNSLDHDPNIPYNQVIKTGLHQALFATSKVIWQPRVGFAWQPTKSGNTVIRGGFGIFGDVFPGQINTSIANNSPLVNMFIIPSGKITPGAPGNLFTTAAAANQSFLTGFANGGTVGSIEASNPFFTPPNFTTMDALYRQARYAEWNLEVQQALPGQMVASVNYVGNHGYHLVIQNNGLNAFAPDFAGLPPVAPDLRFATITQYQTGAISNYNGLVVGLRKRVGSGLQFNAAYTFSHALDEVSNAGFNEFDRNTAPSILFPQNPFNIRQYNYGNADYDVRHFVNMNFVWDDAFRHIFKKGGPEALAGGWTFAGAIFARSGQPFTVIDSSATSALTGNGYGGIIFATPILPGYNSCGQSAVNAATPCLQINQFLPSTANPTGFGNQTRNQYRGPRYFDLDFSVMKNFKIPHLENGRFGIGFQFFNLLNHPNFDKPINDIAEGPGLFGTIDALVSPPTSILGAFVGADASGRIIQLRGQFVF